MEDLQQPLQKITADVRHMQAAIDAGRIDLALASAKRARRDVTSLVRQLADIRDNATANGGTSK